MKTRGAFLVKTEQSLPNLSRALAWSVTCTRADTFGHAAAPRACVRPRARGSVRGFQEEQPMADAPDKLTSCTDFSEVVCLPT